MRKVVVLLLSLGVVAFFASSASASVVPNSKDSKAAAATVTAFLNSVKSRNASKTCSFLAASVIKANFTDNAGCVKSFKQSFTANSTPKTFSFKVIAVVSFVGSYGTVVEVKEKASPKAKASYGYFHLLKEGGKYKIFAIKY